ncbi:hypothetical protein EC988_000680 [Linderina pennispora]|nr:hypothetical protein EC988_000680 [Linderina pennispora]
MSLGTRQRAASSSINNNIISSNPAPASTGNVGISRTPTHPSPPSTIAESLRSYWTSRRGQRRGTDAQDQHLLRQLYKSPRTGTRAMHSGNSRVYVQSSPRVNESVGRLFALIIRDFVQEWYGKITDDQEFTGEVAQQLVLVANEIERRVRKVDWVQFILFEVPDIVNLHVSDAHQCEARLGTVYAGRGTSIEEMFQNMQPHVALSSAADSELAYLRHLAQELLGVFMPPEAHNDEVVFHLLREILACAVLRNVVDAVSDPSTLNEGIIRGLGRYSSNPYFNQADMSRYVTQPMGVADESQRPHGEGRDSKDAQLQDPSSPNASVETMLHDAQTSEIKAASPRSHRNALLHRSRATVPGSPRLSADVDSRSSLDSRILGSVGSAPQSPQAAPAEASEGASPEPAAPATIPSTIAATTAGLSEKLGSQLSFASRWLLRDLFSQVRWEGWKNNTFRGLVYLHLIITQAFSRMFSVFSEYTFSLNQLWQADTIQASYRGAIEPILALANTVLWFDRYNHWVWAQFLFYIFPLVNILAGVAIDRTLVKVVGLLISEQQIAMYVDLLVANLWKPEEGGKFKTSNRPYKTLDQQEMLKKDAADLVAELMPYIASRFFYGQSDAERLLAAQRILDPFENRQLNKHLVYNILDSVVGKIAPELKEKPAA